MVGNAPAIGTPTRARPSVRRHARRHRTCATAVVKPRSTPEGACFMTSPDATVTSTAREVTFYLAVRSPSVPACLPLVPSLTRHRSAVGLVLGPPPAPLRGTIQIPRRAQRLNQKWPQVNRPVEQPALLPNVRAEHLLTDHRSPSPILRSAPSAKESSIADEPAEGRPPRSSHVHLGTARPSRLSCSITSVGMRPRRLRRPVALCSTLLCFASVRTGSINQSLPSEFVWVARLFEDL